MCTLSTFALEIQRGEDHDPSRVSVVLASAVPDPEGGLRLTPEGAINALQDELDVLRERMRGDRAGRLLRCVKDNRPEIPRRLSSNSV
jgi:hypothetical protein